MKIIQNIQGDWLVGYFGYLQNEYNKISNDNSENYLFVGVGNFYGANTQYKDAKTKAVFDVYNPTFLLESTTFKKHFEVFDVIYTICPYTQQIFKEYNCHYVPQHITNPYIKQFNYNKQFDVCFIGSILSANIELSTVIEKISKFNYLYLAADKNMSKYATHYLVGHEERFKLLSQSKICICYNLLYPDKPQEFDNLKSYALDTDFLKTAEKFHILPQLKPRVLEAASSGSLILCRRDPWNTIEDIFIPDKDFIYFDNVEHLPNLIKEISINWEHYSKIAYNAYMKSKKYTLSNLLQYIKGDIQPLWTCNTVTNTHLLKNWKTYQ